MQIKSNLILFVKKEPLVQTPCQIKALISLVLVV